MLPFPQMKGFLGTGATFGADLNLMVEFVMGVALLMGGLLARQKRYAAHGVCQTTVLLLNLLMIALVMWPSFHQQVGRYFRECSINVISLWPQFMAPWGWQLNFWGSTSLWWPVRTFSPSGCVSSVGGCGCEWNSCFGRQFCSAALWTYYVWYIAAWS